MLKVAQDGESACENGAGGSLLDEIVRDGARAMLAAALQAEVAAYVEAHADQLDEAGHRLVVRNGHHAEREVTTAAGAVSVRAPRVNDKRIDEESGERMRFSSAILPAWARKSPRVAEVLPLLYLHGLSSSDFGPALEQFLGSGAGLSASTITRLVAQWQDEAAAFNKRPLKGTDYVYCWVDGIHLGMRAPVLAVGDGALGFWKALREVFPETIEQRCWWHKMGNVLNCLPKSAQPGARAALAEIYNAEDKDHALAAAKAFADLYGAKWPKAVAKITDDLDVLLAFYDYPAEHWVHLRTTNPIESTFATVRLRQRVTKGPGSRSAGVAMAFKLIESAQARWRAVNAPHLVALVRAGARFERGILIERPDESGGDQQVA